jgi:CRISPR-associated endonuclease/helicase Cas3
MMIPRAWPEWLNEVWAKSAAKGAGDQPETLAQHTWDVLEKLAETIRLRPDLPQSLRVPRLWHCLFWASFLHDYGKAARGFQARLRGGEAWKHRHEVLSLAFVDWLVSAFSAEELHWVVAAIVSHHRDEDEIQRLYNSIGDPDDQVLASLVAEIDESVIHGLWRWIDECVLHWPQALGLDTAGIEMPDLPTLDSAMRLVRDNGASNIRKWLKDYHRWLERAVNRSDDVALVVGTILLRGHLISSDHMASAHVGELPSPQLAEPHRLLEGWKLTSDRLYDHQRESLHTRGSAVLMAPTGSGKTEAALLWAVAQAQPNRPVPRLYYALPFQASMNAMLKRLNDDQGDLAAPFPGQVGLEHSRSVLAYYQRFLDESYAPQAAAKEAKWRRNLAALNYYPVRVLSPYQLLKAPYRLKGYEALLTDCFEATFIFDEIHAYEAGRLAKILATAKYLRENYAARFFVMSATLPQLLRDRLADALGGYRLIQATQDVYARFQRHALKLRDGDLLDDQTLDHIARVAAGGQRSVLVCCNTVDRAQQAREGLLKRLAGEVEAVLLHGRFNGKDRLEKEDAIRNATGSRSTQRRPVVLVATQVVEVSLDVDLDVIYSDPAPLEALLQRFGRINRRVLRKRAPVYVFREPVSDKPRPYEPALIQAALRVLEKNDGELIDEAQVSDWLDEVYSDRAISDKWNAEYQSAYEDFCDGVLASLRAFQSDKELEAEFYKAFDSVEVLPIGLSDDYEKLRDEDPLSASRLLVPIRWQQWMILKSKGLTREDQYLKEVDVYYDSDVGLDFKRGTRDLEDL